MSLQEDMNFEWRGEFWNRELVCSGQKVGSISLSEMRIEVRCDIDGWHDCASRQPDAIAMLEKHVSELCAAYGGNIEHAIKTCRIQELKHRINECKAVIEKRTVQLELIQQELVELCGPCGVEEEVK